MIKSAILLLFLHGSMTLINLHAQSMPQSGTDSLQIYFAQKNFDAYFRHFDQFSNNAFAHKDANTLFSLSELLQQDFGPLDSSIRKRLRNTAARLGFYISKLTGNVDESLTVYLIAHHNVENQQTLDSLSWYIENNISNFYTMKGDFEKADYFSVLLENSLQHYGMVEQLSRLYTNRGRKLVSEFKTKEAVTIFKRGYALADSIGYTLGVFANALNLAEIYNQQKDTSKSSQYLKVAEDVIDYLKQDSRYLEKKSGLLLEKAQLKFLQQDYTLAIQLYNQSIDTLGRFYPTTTRREFAKSYTALAKTYLVVDSLEMALQTIQKGFACLVPDLDSLSGLPLESQLYAENSFIDLYALRASVLENQYEVTYNTKFLESALDNIEKGIQVNDMIRDLALADPSKLISIQYNKKLIDQGISVLHLLSMIEGTAKHMNQARYFFNRSKSLLYSEKNQRHYLYEFMSANDQAQWKSLLQDQLKLHHRKQDPLADVNFLHGEILLNQARQDSLFSKYQDLRFEFVTPEHYVEYFIGEKDIYGIASIAGESFFQQLGSVAQLQPLITRLQEFILLKGLSMDDSIQYALFIFLLQPFATSWPDHLVMIPDGVIGYIPFEMLKDDAGDLLIEKMTIAYAFEYLSHKRTGTVESDTPEIFCLAPQYPQKAGPQQEVTRGSIYHLPYALMEVDSIRQLFGEQARSSQSGDKQVWGQQVSTCQVFHYAGHAIVDGDQSYLALSSAGNQLVQLTAHEISLMHHPLELAVLSACETGLGKLDQGEGIRSLGRSFMESGSKATVISLWTVNDRSTALIMTEFYKQLKKGKRKDEALRLAKLYFLESASTRNRHPYFWAAFIPAGDMNPLLYP